MDVLVVFGIFVVYFYSVVEYICYMIDLSVMLYYYFEISVVLIILILLGKLFELYVILRIIEFIVGLFEL